jgi:aminopeptidase N
MLAAVLVALAAAVTALLVGCEPPPGGFHHALTVSLFPADRSLRAVDSVYVTPDAVTAGKISFLVTRSVSVENVASPVKIKRWFTQAEVDPTVFKADPDSEDLEVIGRSMGIFIELADVPAGGAFPIAITYAGVIHDSLRAPSESYPKGFDTTTGLIGNEGTFLTNESVWYPFQFGRMFSFTLKVDVPSDWMTVSQGALAAEHIAKAGKVGEVGGEERRHEVWVERNPTPELYLVAGRYVRHDDSYDGIKIMTYTYEPSDSLCQVYIDATKRYLSLYEDLIGPYPYPKFALVENYWQTGFGMPSFTLLGSQVIRLPFIVNTSYGHEILHNWWGNSVYVDYSEGNWCEGLTTYQADYLYKEIASAAEAREYRHSTLIAFDNYVTERKDFPLMEFLERSDAATQSVGYGKSLMIYHMLRRNLGDDLFRDGLRKFYARFKFKEASWSDLEAVFSETAGRDLSGFFDQWLERTGAPTLRLLNADVTGQDARHAVTFTLEQTEPAFSLDVPVVVETTHGTERSVLPLSGRYSVYTLETRSQPLALAVDPDYDLFRDLYVEEMPMTLGRLFASDSVAVIVGGAEADDARSAYREVAAAWGLGETIIEEPFGGEAEAPPAGSVWLMGRGAALDRFLARQPSDLGIATDEVRLADSTYALAGNTFVCAVRNRGNPDLATGVVLTQDPASLRALAARLPHYSSYSYLLFQKTRPALRGVWKEGRSPLAIDFRAR